MPFKVKRKTLKVYNKPTKDADAGVLYGYGRIENMGKVPDEDKEIKTIMDMISYNF